MNDLSNTGPELNELRRPLTVTVEGTFAQQLRTLADQVGWSLDELVGHVVGNMSELASRGLLISDDAEDHPAYNPTYDGTNVTVQRG